MPRGVCIPHRAFCTSLVLLVAAAPLLGQAGQSSRAPDAVIASVQAAVSQSDTSAAAARVSEALTAYPADPNLHNLAGVVAAQRGETEAAEGYFRHAIELAPRAAAAYENLGRLYQERGVAQPGAMRSAIDVYRRWLQMAPSSEEAAYQLAFLLTNSGAFGEGLTTIERLPPQVLSQPHVAAVRVAALEGSGQTAHAVTLAGRLTNDPTLNEADVIRLVPAFEKSPTSKAALVLLEGLARRPAATLETLRALAALKAHAGDLAGARQVLERAFAAGPASAATLVELARVAYRQRDFEGALGYLAHARTLEPSSAGIHFLFGVVCIELNLVSEAYESLKKAIALDPDNPSFNYVLGAVSLHRPDPGEALPYFERYMQLEPNDPRGVFALGVACFHTNDFDRAKVVLTQAAAREQTAAGAHYFLGRIARQQNDPENARRHIEESLRLVPDYADAHAELGLIATRQGRLEEAEASLRRALSLDPENYAATVNLTALYTRTHDPRREEMAAKLQALQQKRADQAQEFLRIIEVVP